MNHRIAAGALVVEDESVLLVRHRKPGAYDFWVAPGGGVEGEEDLHRALRREVKEECGLDVEPGRVAYVEDLIAPGVRCCKIWFLARVVGGELLAGSAAAQNEFIVDARFLSRSQLDGRMVFPPVLRDVFWRDIVSGFPSPTYLGLRNMEFW